MAFATADDVATRLLRDLTPAETSAVEAVLAIVTDLMVNAAGKTAEGDISPVPAALKLLAIEKAIQLLNNPRGLASLSEQLGSASRSETYPRASDIGLFLSDAEERLIRNAVLGATRGSAKVRSIVDEMADYVYPDPIP